jgi:hypothetical protein
MTAIAFLNGQARAIEPGESILAFARRETIELLRDPVRLAFGLLGPLFLLITLGYGISFDVEREGKNLVVRYCFSSAQPLFVLFITDLRCCEGCFEVVRKLSPDHGDGHPLDISQTTIEGAHALIAAERCHGAMVLWPIKHIVKHRKNGLSHERSGRRELLGKRYISKLFVHQRREVSRRLIVAS